MAKSKATELLALLEAVSEDELAEIDKEIAAVKAKLGSLESARKLIAARLGLVPEKKPKAPPAEKKFRSAPGGGPSIVQRVIEYIAKNGPERVAVLADKLNAGQSAIYNAIGNNQHLFEKSNDGVHLTTAGHQAAKEKAA